MKTFFQLIVISLVTTLASIASARLDVVATEPGLAALVREVGQGNVKVESLAAPAQDPHFVDGRPSYVVKLNKADLVVYTGLALEIGWLPPLVHNARNGKIQLGQPGNLDASSVAGKLLDRKGNNVDAAKATCTRTATRTTCTARCMACASPTASRLDSPSSIRITRRTTQANAKAFKHRMAKKRRRLGKRPWPATVGAPSSAFTRAWCTWPTGSG